MKRILLIIVFMVIAVMTFAQVSVSGYYRKNGTYVQPYVRSSSDQNPYNNYSYPGNTNPYTGKVATGNPDVYLNKYNKAGGYTSSVNSSTTPDVLPQDLKQYLVNKKGLRTGYYIIPFEQDNFSTTYHIYDMYDSVVGSISEYTDGSKYIYDIYDRLIKHVKAKKK